MTIQRGIWRALPLAAVALFVATPVFAKKPATCDQIQSELKSGKSVAEVAKNMHVSTKHVQQCSASPVKTK